MTQQQFIEEIRRLSVEERIGLIEVIARSVREDLITNSGDAAISGKEFPEADVQHERRAGAVQRLHGILKFDGDPPTDEEVKDMYADYLTEKYS